MGSGSQKFLPRHKFTLIECKMICKTKKLLYSKNGLQFEKHYFAVFEVLTEVSQRIQADQEVTLLCGVGGSQHFKRTCCLHVLGLLTLEGEDDMILQNIRNHSPNDTTSHSRTLESMGKDSCILYKQNCAVLVCCEESFAFT